MASFTGRRPGKAILALLAASALFAAAGLMPAFVPTGMAAPHLGTGATVSGVMASRPLQAAGQAPVQAMRGMGCVLLVLGVLAARNAKSGERAKGCRLAGKVVLQASQQAQKASEMMLPSLIDLDVEPTAFPAAAPVAAPAVPATAPALAPAMAEAPAAAFGQTVGKAKPRRARAAAGSARRARRQVGARLCASLRYETPPASFDPSRLRTRIQMGLKEGSPKLISRSPASKATDSNQSRA
ncbi:unnamed protein product, partial [Effrenium voratum]